MTAPITIALDAMGGDHGPKVVIPAAALSHVRHPDIRYLFFGQEPLIRKELEAYPDLHAHAEVIHTDILVAMDAKPSQALRKGRHGSSMWLAIEAVKKGNADIAISGGNTGALMAMAKVCLKTLPGIERPAIAAIWPTVDAECIVLDVGANVGADARQLFEFALMGVAMARALFGLERPRVGLLNVGVEEIKGLDEVKKANALLRSANLPIEYQGFVEGNDVGHGAADVIVTEGFSGNIALKTAEGTAKQIGQYIKAAMASSLISKFGAFLAQGAFAALKEKMDPRGLNGGLFLGLNGVVIKSHGGTDETGYASAIDLGFDMAKSQLVTNLAEDVRRFNDIGEEELS